MPTLAQGLSPSILVGLMFAAIGIYVAATAKKAVERQIRFYQSRLAPWVFRALGAVFAVIGLMTIYSGVAGNTFENQPSHLKVTDCEKLRTN